MVPCSDDFDIIRWDVSRCWHLHTRKEREQKNLLHHMRDPEVAARAKAKQQGLTDLINALMMVDQSDLFYFQGFHELSSVFFNVLCPIEEPIAVLASSKVATGLDLTLPIELMSSLSLSHWNDLLKEDFSNLDTLLQVSLFPLLARLDPQVHEHLNSCSIHPTFAVSWIITWFSHDVRDTEVAKRLFDFFLASHPIMTIYVAVAMITHPSNRERILETEAEYSQIYGVLRELPKYSHTEAVVTTSTESLDNDPFAESDGSTASESGFSLDARSRECSTLERVFHDIVEETESQLRDDSQGGDCSSCIDDFVPIEDVLDLALEYMTYIPPVRLLTLASTYYGTEERKRLIARTRTISTFDFPSRPPRTSPIWQHPLAFAALGYGPEAETRQRRATQRKCLLLSALATLLFAWTCHIWYGTLVGRTEVHVVWITAQGRLSELTNRLEAVSTKVLGIALGTYLKGGNDLSSDPNTGAISCPRMSGPEHALVETSRSLDVETTLDLDEMKEHSTNDILNTEDANQAVVERPAHVGPVKSRCLKNASAAMHQSMFLSNRESWSTSYCLVSWALTEFLSDRRRT